MSDWDQFSLSLLPHPQWGQAGAVGELDYAGLCLVVESIVSDNFHLLNLTFSTCCGTRPDQLQIKRAGELYRGQGHGTVDLICEACGEVFQTSHPLQIQLVSEEGVLSEGEAEAVHAILNEWLALRQNDPLECEVYSASLMDFIRHRYLKGWRWTIFHD